jgi:hypothetical protein
VGTHLLDWEKIRLVLLPDNSYALQTVNGRYLTAVGGGGRITDTIHSNATVAGAWEKFHILCGAI